ncbi:MAG: beta-lactamase family protein [Lysobacter sp.]|nr:beta-lactamase family protein [Lysobacter sp.]
MKRPNRRRQRRCALALALLASIGSTHAQDHCDAQPDDAAAAASQAMLDALVRTNGVPGMGASVWREGKVVWTGCAGWQDLEARTPVTADTVFRLASVSKMFAVTAAAKLTEQHRLDLDAPITQALPWLRKDWSPITLRLLAAHTSGIPHYQSGDATVGQRHYATSREAVALFSSRTLLSAPGTEYHYSSWGYTLMGAAIEAASGQHFLDYVAQQVTPGLNIQADTDGHGERVARLYDLAGGVHRVKDANDFSYTWPGGGLAGTPESVATFGGRLLQGRIVAPRTFAQMLRPAHLANGQPVGDDDYRLAFGWRLSTDRDGLHIAHHAGVTPGARSALVLWPQQQASASVLSNALWVSSIDKTAMMLAAPFLPQPAGLVETPCPTSVASYSGQLGDRRFQGDIRFKREGGRCVGELNAANALGDYFKSAQAWSDRTITLIGLSADGDLGRAALVSPYGIYDLRALGQGRYEARFSEQLRLELQI